jgi:precorrin-8X/cobalt-precorrin-8 methylmutase
MEKLKPMEIEARSFEMLARELEERGLASKIAPETALVVKRVIHTTADFDYAENLVFSPGAVRAGLDALRGGAHVVTDTTMALAGINKRALASLGGAAHCFIADEDVARIARERGETRARVSMERAAELDAPLIFAIGNAPTALLRLRELIAEGRAAPALVIGAPVGFVHVVEAKELFLHKTTDGETPFGIPPSIVARGRKGGSNVAAAIVNALLYQITDRGN